MLRTTDRNTKMLAQINAVIDAFGGGENQRKALIIANDDALSWSGIKAIQWSGDGAEFAITWEMKQGGIIHVTARKVVNGPVRIISEKRFFD